MSPQHAANRIVSVISDYLRFSALPIRITSERRILGFNHHDHYATDSADWPNAVLTLSEIALPQSMGFGFFAE